MWDRPLDHLPEPIPPPYVLTTDRSTADEAVAIVFHLPTLPPGLIERQLTKKKGQLWVDLGKVEQGAGEPIDLVDRNHVDLRPAHIGQEALQSWPVQSYSGITPIVILGRRDHPMARAPEFGCARNLQPGKRPVHPIS